MLTYQIRLLKGTHKPTTENFLSKEHILSRQLAKCNLNIGDRVKFRKPKRNSVYGTLAGVITDFKDVKWSRGVVPNCLEILVEKKDRKTNIVYGLERVFTSPKQVVLIARGVDDG